MAERVFVTGRDNPDLPMESCPHKGMQPVVGVVACEACDRVVRQLAAGDVVYVPGDDGCAHLTWAAMPDVVGCSCGRVVQLVE